MGSLMDISANLGFLFTELALPDAIRKAKSLGFSAVECHFPFGSDAESVRAALEETGLPMLSLNTSPGNAGDGDFGLAAIPGRKREARIAIDEAIAYAGKIGCRYVHVMAGRANGTRARETFADNLKYAADRVGHDGMGILIEPLNSRDVPGYFLANLDQATDTIAELDLPPVRIMFDCYHMQIIGGNLIDGIEKALPLIGHVQFASVPDRAEPDHGEVDYFTLLPAIKRLGYDGHFGAEYRPGSGSFEWLRLLT
jgi:2-dehydrotetronate isomerase